MVKNATGIKPIPGPHHCVGVSVKTQNWIFKALLQQTDLLGGSITRSEIEDLERAFSIAIEPKFEISIESYNHCMSSHNNRKFDKKMIFRGIIGSYIADLLPIIFPEQYVVDPRRWKYICTSFVASVVEAILSGDVYDRYLKLYICETAEKRQNLNISDMLVDREFIDLTRWVLAEMRNAYSSQENTIIEQLCARFNDHVRREANYEHRHALFIKVRQMAEFLDGLYCSNTRNKFRAAVLEVPATPS